MSLTGRKKEIDRIASAYHDFLRQYPGYGFEHYSDGKSHAYRDTDGTEWHVREATPEDIIRLADQFPETAIIDLLEGVVRRDAPGFLVSKSPHGAPELVIETVVEHDPYVAAEAPHHTPFLTRRQRGDMAAYEESLPSSEPALTDELPESRMSFQGVIPTRHKSLDVAKLREMEEKALPAAMSAAVQAESVWHLWRAGEGHWFQLEQKKCPYDTHALFPQGPDPVPDPRTVKFSPSTSLELS